MATAFMHGWIALPSEGEMLFEHGVPVAVRTTGRGLPDIERMIGEITEVSGFDVTIGPWQPLDESGEMHAELRIDAREIDEVLRRLAMVSADTFVDRYGKTIDAEDVDFDDEAYAHDFGVALNACGLAWGQADETALRREYLRTLHEAAEERVTHPE